MSLVSVSIVTALVLLHPWLITTVHSLHDGEHPLVVDYDEHYYYKSVRDKMAESLSVNNCSIDSITIETNYNSYSNYDKTKQFQDLSITVVKPPITVLEKWGDNNKKRLKSRIFTQVSSNLCSSKRFKEVKKGIFKRAKGCYKVYAIDKNGIRKKRFNDYGATLHPEHVRCYTDDGVGVCSRNGDSNGMITVPNQYRELQQYPFLVTANRAVIGRGGMFALPCGPFGLFASCEAVKWGLPAANAVVQDVEKCRDSGGSCPYQKYDKVFVMTQYDDTQIGK